MRDMNILLSRRAILALAAGAAVAAPRPLRAETLPLVTVSKDPNCGCCQKWADHLAAAGFPVKVIDTDAMDAIKHRLGVPEELVSCHTAQVGGYVIEGHVPAAAVLRLLQEKPKAAGLAVPGMPAGSPGMEGGIPEIYDVVLFGPDGRSIFGRFREKREATGL